MTEKRDLRIVFMGTPDFAVATLKALLDHFTGRSSTSGANKDKKIQQDVNKAKKEEKEEIKTITQRLRKWETQLFENERGLYSAYIGAKMFGTQLMSGRASIESFGGYLKI